MTKRGRSIRFIINYTKIFGKSIPSRPLKIRPIKIKKLRFRK